MIKVIHIYCYDDFGEIINRTDIEFTTPINMSDHELEDLDLSLYYIFGDLFDTVDVEAEYA